MIGYWPFNGNADDKSINNNNGVVTGAKLTTDRFGNKDATYYFDGKGDYIDCGDSANLFVSTNTINFWFLYSDTTLTQQFVNDANSQNGEWGVQYYHHSSAGLVAGIHGGSTDLYIGATTKNNNRYADSSWHMFTCSYNSKDNSILFYIDAEYISGITIQNGGFVNGKDSLVHSGQDHWIFGARSQYFSNGSSSPSYLNGNLDDIMLFNRVLSKEEITSLYSESNSISNQPVLSNVQVYPNPANDVLSIVRQENSDNIQKLSIFNINGEIVYEKPILQSFTYLNVGEFKNGM